MGRGFNISLVGCQNTIGRGFDIPMVGGSTYHGYNFNAVFTVRGQCKIEKSIRTSFLYVFSIIYEGNIVFILGSNFRHCKW